MKRHRVRGAFAREIVMLDIVNKRLGGRVALLVNTFLAVMIVAGTGYVYAMLAQNIDAQFVSKGQILSAVGAQSVARIIEEGIDNGALTPDRVFNMTYDPIPGTRPIQYRSSFDAYLDRAILTLQDEFLGDPSVLYAVSLDVNGYLPTHNSRYRQPSTGNGAADRFGNLAKRIFKDVWSAQAAENLSKGFVQSYTGDTGEPVIDVSSPIYVKGRHWGFFRIGLAPAASGAAKQRMLMSLAASGLVFLFFSGGVIFYIVNRSMKPLVEFSRIAVDLADGDVDQKITVDRQDEIGRVAEALERLRISLKAAIERLMRR